MNANKAIPNVIIFVSFIMFLCRFIILENGRGFFSSMAQISRKWSFEMEALLWTFTPWLLVHVVVCEITIFVQDYSFLKNGLLLTAEEMTSTIETIYFSHVVHVFTLCIRETEGSETNRSSENWYCCKLWMFIRHYLKFVIIFFLNETHHGEHCIDTAHTFYFAHCHLDVFDKQDEDLNVKLHVHWVSHKW